jgi:cation diffusion facilitator family transporter
MTREKRRAALGSVLAAVLLTATKLVVGLLTLSLGIIAEALHSGLDLVAGIVTYVAVRTSDEPADEEHLYGHGKIESLSALIESALLFITCGWIIYEAARRIFGHGPEIQVNFWALAVMVLSIAVNLGRYLNLNRVARRYRSQALEADALHFSTDIFGSLAVIAGLIAVKWLHFRLGDPLVALGVAGIVVYAAVELAIRAGRVLLDQAPKTNLELARQGITAVPDVESYSHLRIRYSGDKTFVDVTIKVDPSLPITRAHEVSEKVESEIAKRVEDSDIVVHVEPAGSGGSIRVKESAGVMDRAHALQQIEQILREHFPQYVEFHDLSADNVDNVPTITFHLVMPENAHVRETHQFCDHIEQDLEARFANARISIHVEPCDRKCDSCQVSCEARPLTQPDPR